MGKFVLFLYFFLLKICKPTGGLLLRQWFDGVADAPGFPGA